MTTRVGASDVSLVLIILRTPTRIRQFLIKVITPQPGPIPGLRPPMGAGSHHQAVPKGNSMGFIMPLYTIGIVAFFIYTVMKLVCKKTPAPPEQVPPARSEVPQEPKEEIKSYIPRPEDGRTKLGKWC